jgi:hypothetical protein
MPFGADTAGFHITIKYDPTAFVVTSAVINVSLIVFAYFDAFAPRVKLSVQRLTVPPSDRAQQ